MTCQMAGKPCRRAADTLYRIRGLGDRWLCLDDAQVLREMGFDIAPAPRWLGRPSLVKDMTGAMS